MYDKLIQNIFNHTEPYLPKKWHKLAMYILFTPGSYEIKYYYSDGKKYIDCFDSGVDTMTLIKLFDTIAEESSKVRNTLKGKDKWSVMTLLVDSKGKVNTYFEYEDMTENSIKYIAGWRNKYIK